MVIVIASQMMQQVRMRRRWCGPAGRSGVQRGYAAGERADEWDEHGRTVGYTPGVIRPGVPVRGWFITIEGPEGAGKTTQASALATHLRGTGLDVHVTREPGGTWLGERLREVLLARTDAAAATDPLTDALLFNAARRQLVTEVIRPALDARPDGHLRALRGLDAGLPGLRRRRARWTGSGPSRRPRPTG